MRPIQFLLTGSLMSILVFGSFEVRLFAAALLCIGAPSFWREAERVWRAHAEAAYLRRLLETEPPEPPRRPKRSR